jgi:hypothetical protein
MIKDWGVNFEECSGFGGIVISNLRDFSEISELRRCKMLRVRNLTYNFKFEGPFSKFQDGGDVNTPKIRNFNLQFQI